MNWIAQLALRLYPAWWRQRYGTELQALVEDSGPTWRTVLDLGKEGMAMQLRDFRSPLYLVLGCGLLGAGAGAAVFAATPSRLAVTNSIEVQSPLESPDTRLRALVSGAFSDDNFGRLVERFDLYREEQGGRELADAIRRFRADISLTLTPSGFDVSFGYPDGPKAQEVLANLTSLLIDANLRAAQGSGGGPSERYRVAGPPRQERDGPNVMGLTAIGLGAGLLIGLALTAVRRRAQPR